MLKKIADFVAGLVLSRLLIGAGMLLLVSGVVFSLVYGRDALMALGLSREVAGSIATVFVVAACIYGLYLFATKAIDW